MNFQQTPPPEGMGLPSVVFLDMQNVGQLRRRRTSSASELQTLDSSLPELQQVTNVRFVSPSSTDTTPVLEVPLEFYRERTFGANDASGFQTVSGTAATVSRFIWQATSATDVVRISLPPAFHLHASDASTFTATVERFARRTAAGSQMPEHRRRQHFIFQRLTKLFRQAREERFESGMNSSLGLGLLKAAEDDGEAILSELQRLIFTPSTSSDVAAEALRWVPRFPVEAHLRARETLESALVHISPVVRDGAIAGLASLDNPESIPALLMALEREPVPELREDLKQVLSQLSLR